MAERAKPVGAPAPSRGPAVSAERAKPIGASAPSRGPAVSAKPKKEALQTWVEDEDLPPLGVKASASSRDPDLVHGIKHKKIPTKKTREHLSSLKTKLQKMNEAHEGGCWVNPRAYSRIKREFEQLAPKSDAASLEKGHSFQDSFGNRQLEPEATEANLVAIALTLYRRRRQ